jgi:predicted enzyme related to lactoylglutathione lyase
MLEPSAIVFYVNDLAISSHFYQELLGIDVEELSPTFRRFNLSNGMIIGLKDKHTAHLTMVGNGGCELAFTAANHEQVDALFLAWQQQGISIKEPPTNVSFGYTFIAVDPDGNRLRVLA